MATLEDVRRLALALPGTDERVDGHTGGPSWRVKGKLFVWERPLGKSDLAALGAAAPTGAVLGASVADVGEKGALLASGGAFFTTPHFDGHAIVLVALESIDADELAEIVTEAWFARASGKLAKAYREANS